MMYVFFIEKLQERLVNLVSKAYSNIGIEEFSQQLGVNKDGAVQRELELTIFLLLRRSFE